MNSYTILAAYYDRLTTDVGYERWADYIEGHFRRHKRPIQKVVDLACGTGSLTRLLAERGYGMTAIDLSPDMLTAAAQKCEGLGVQLLCQDMCRLRLLEPMDAVVCCLDSINYVTRPRQLLRAMERVHRWLKPGGLFLFDVKTPQALMGADGQMYLDETEELFCVWRGEYFPRRRICGYGIDLFALQPDGSWRREGEYHEEYAYTTGEIAGMLEQAGFARWKLYGDLRFGPPKDGEQRVFFAAGKDG